MSATLAARADYARVPDEDLLLIYHQERDPAARDELVRRFIPFARKLALRYVHSREPLDDLVQVACLGLLNALTRFEPGMGKKFTSYAAPTIMGELKRHFRDKGWSMHVPRDLQERALAVSRQMERLSAQLGRSPTVDELAGVLECTVEQVIEALDAAHNYLPASLDAPIAHEEEDRCALGETLGTDDNGFELAEDRQALVAGWASLTDIERQVLGLRLVHELTQREISQKIGCSQMHVSRLLRRSMMRLDAAAVAA
ncbi:MAG TPA: SigB/SigF/SigG family RNA polymerase sigma factor [Solirubrobacteraceae bacterium]|nr:SigB/SigF/SigG family RNA polymerase sigma factor [Solirubrobacteraceae bacterium]